MKNAPKTFIIPILLLSSCSFMGGPSYEIEKPKYDVEVETIGEVAAQEVDDTKTDFFVPTYEDNAAWDRTKIFFVKYLDMPDLRGAIQKSGKTAIVTNNNAGNSKYRYEVKKELFGNGYNYFVKCKPSGSGTSQKQAIRNAKNLSRFINEGTLETTLLK